MINPQFKKILILNSILLIIIPGILLILNPDALINMFAHKRIGLCFTDDEDGADEKYYAKQDMLKADFEKVKNDTIPLPDEIIKIIIFELEVFNWNEEFQEVDLCSIYHETIFSKYFPSKGTPDIKFIVVTFSNHTGNFFHAASGRISLFEFQKKHQSWKMTNKYIAFGYGNEYGLEPVGCELVRIGNNNRYALIEHTSYSGNGGHEKESDLVYSVIGHELKPVFEFTSYEYYFDYPRDIEYKNEYSNMRILESNKAWFDIETKSKETEWNDQTPGEVKRFVFNGEEYVEAFKRLSYPTNL